MKLFRLLILTLSATYCTANVRGVSEDTDLEEIELYNEENELERDDSTEEDVLRDLKRDETRSYGSYFKKGRGKKGNFGPVSSPVFAPTPCVGGGCGVPTPCGAGGCPGTPTCGSGDGCGLPPTSVSPPGKGKGGFFGGKKGFSGKKGGGGYYGKKGGFGGKKGKGKGGGFRPPCPGGNCPPLPPNNGTCGCPIDEVMLDFVKLPFNVTVPVAPNLPASTIGTVFIYNDALFDLNFTALPGTFVAGLCHRTQLTQNVGQDNTLLGGGYCWFTYTVSDGVTSVTFNAAGEVFDILGGTLAITGGTGPLSGTYGEVEIVPVYAGENQVDFFTEAQVYVSSASLFVPLF